MKSYASRMAALITQAQQIPSDLPPQRRWEELRKLTCQFGFTSEEFVAAGRQSGFYPSHEERLRAATPQMLVDEAWSIGFREFHNGVGEDGVTLPPTPLSEADPEMLFDKLLEYYHVQLIDDDSQ